MEKFHEQKERDRDLFKVVITQRDVEIVETKTSWQQEAAQQMSECQDHFKRMESDLNQVPSNQAVREQRSQRDLDMQAEEFQARNRIFEEQLAMQKQCDQELRIVQERLSFQTIDMKWNSF